MQDFIVLGLIPGTHIQLTFQMWLLFCMCLVLATLFYSFWHTLYVRFLSWQFARLIRRYDISPFVMVK